MNSKWEVLLNRKCIDILIGDVEVNVKDVSTYDFNAFLDFPMPYLSGCEIVDISKTFGLNANYASPQQSRWQYMNDLVKHCIETDKIQQLLKGLFDMANFEDMLKNFDSIQQIKDTYNILIDQIATEISKVFVFSGYKFSIPTIGIFSLSKDDELPEIEIPIIKLVDFEYITDMINRAKRDVNNKDFDSALTKSRTLLEEVFCYIIEANGESPSEKGKIAVLYNQVKKLYNMHQVNEADERINTLLSGLEKILSSIGNMRTKAGDSHGVGSKRIEIEEHHARLYVNSAMTFAEFVLSVHLNKKDKDKQ